MIVSILLKHSLGWLRPGPAVREALYSLMSDGTKEHLKCSVQHLGRRCFVAGSAHTAGGGRYVIWCETSGSRFSSDDTHSPPCTLWQALNNTHTNLWHIWHEHVGLARFHAGVSSWMCYMDNKQDWGGGVEEKSAVNLSWTPEGIIQTNWKVAGSGFIKQNKHEPVLRLYDKCVLGWSHVIL